MNTERDKLHTPPSAMLPRTGAALGLLALFHLVTPTVIAADRMWDPNFSPGTIVPPTPEPTPTPIPTPEVQFPREREFQVENLRFFGFSPEDERYITRSLEWLRATGAKINYQGEEMTIYDYLQSAPIPFIKFTVSSLGGAAAKTAPGDGRVLVNETALYSEGFSRETQMVLWLVNLVHEGGVHSRQARDNGYNLSGFPREMEAEAYGMGLQALESLVPYASDTVYRQTRHVVEWMRDQVGNSE